VTDVRDWLRVHWWVLVLLAVTLAGTFGRWHAHPRPGAGVLAGLAVLVLLARRKRPELTWLGNAAAVTCYFALGYPDGPVYLSVFASAFALTSRWTPRRWWPYAAAVLPVVLAMASRWSGASLASVAGRSTWVLAVLAASTAVGAAMRTRTETRREQARRTATEERLRMAQDLHDGVGHGLAVIAMQAGVALHVLDQDPAKARESLLAIRDSSRESLAALRAELSRLATVPGAAAPRAAHSGLEDLSALVGRVRAGGLDVDLHVLDPAGRPDAQVAGAAAYLVVQEALTNVLRHSGATSARVEVTAESGALVVTVVDDGQGGEVTEGLGIGSMRSRVERLGGTLSVGPTARGFEVRAVIPEETP
jgi:signal transduction histidine kinase